MTPSPVGPPNPLRVPIRHRFMVARASRRWAEVEDLGARILRSQPGDVMVARALARLAQAQGRARDALAHWRALRAAAPSDLEAAFHLARAGEDLGDLPLSGRSVLDRALAPHGGAPPIHHVAICGVSYCGSTLIDRVLGGLPGTASIGESHWLTKERRGGDYREIDLATDLGKLALVPCSVCGPSCEVLTLDFRLGLAADHGDWYQRIARRLGVSRLVSADKNTPKLVDNDPLLRMAALLVFKSPEQAWSSKLNKLPEGLSEEALLEECRKYVRVWTSSYRTYLDSFAPEGPVAVLSFDAFAQDPSSSLRALCAALGLPFDAGVLRETRPGHAIGGNKGSMARLRAIGYRVDVEPLPDPALPAAHARLLGEDEAMQATHEDLLRRHQALVAKSPLPVS